MGCCSSSAATDAVQDKRANGQGMSMVSRQYGPQTHGRVSVTSGGSINPHNGLGDFDRQPLPSPPAIPEDIGSVFIARYAYQARTAEDLSFEKGEKLKVRMNLCTFRHLYVYLTFIYIHVL